MMVGIMILSDLGTDGAVWGLVGAAVTAVGAVAVKILMARHQISQDERRDLRDEWKELATRQQSQIDSQQQRIIGLEAERDDCHQKYGELQARVVLLEYRLNPEKGVGS